MLHIAAEVSAKSFITWRHVADIAKKLMTLHDQLRGDQDIEEGGNDEDDVGEDEEGDVEVAKVKRGLPKTSSIVTSSSSSSSSSTKLSFQDIHKIAEKSFVILIKLKPDDDEVY